MNQQRKRRVKLFNARKLRRNLSIAGQALAGRLIPVAPLVPPDFEAAFADPANWAEMARRIEALGRGLDDHSRVLLEETVWRLRVSCPPVRRGFFYAPERVVGDWDREMARRWRKEKKACRKRYGFRAAPEVFFMEHGLRFLPARCRDYLRGKAFIDAGAFIGDSALVLAAYEPERIVCCEASRKNIERMKDILARHQLTERIEIVHAAIGGEVGSITFDDVGDTTARVDRAGGVRVPLETIDHLAAERGLTVGLIKADIEGMGLQMTRAMVETLQRDRPVVSVAIYHNMEEFFGIKPFIERLDLNYRFRIYRLRPHDRRISAMGEETLLAYPAELDD